MCATVLVTYWKYACCSFRSHQAGVLPVPPVEFCSKSVIHGAGLPPQPDCQKIGTSFRPAAAALASSWSNSVNSNVPCAGSIVPHGMLSSASSMPAALMDANWASVHGVPLSSNCNWVDHSFAPDEPPDPAAAAEPAVAD
jgi:hypothetical protein